MEDRGRRQLGALSILCAPPNLQLTQAVQTNTDAAGNPINSSDSTGEWACLNDLSFHGTPRPPPPEDYPQQCSSNYTGSAGFCYLEQPDDHVSASSLAECCALAETHWGPRRCKNGHCQGGSARNYNYFEKNNTCQLFGYAWRGGPVEGCSSGEHIYKPPPGPPPPAPCACKRLNETVGRRNESNQNYGGGGSSGLPSSCGRNYDMHHSRFLNGTAYETLPIPPNGSLAGCCAKCSADPKCDGWQMGNMSKKHTHCSFIRNGTLLNQGKVMIASVAKNSANGGGGGGGNMM